MTYVIPSTGLFVIPFIARYLIFVLVFIVKALTQSRRWQSALYHHQLVGASYRCCLLNAPSFYRSEYSLISRILSSCRLCSDKPMITKHIVTIRKCNWASFLILSYKSPALRRRTTRRVRYCQESEDGAEYNRCSVRARCGPIVQGVALRVRVIPNRGHDEVRAVHGDHATLCQSRSRIRLLDGRMDA